MARRTETSSTPLRVIFVTSQWPSENNPAGAPFVKKEVESLRQAGVIIDVFLYRGGWNIRRYIRAIRQLQRRINSNPYDLIHVRFGQSGIVGRAQLKLPVVITYGGSDIEGSPVYYGLNRYRNYVLIGISRLLSLFVNEVIVVSEHLGRKLPRRRYHVIPSGVDLKVFEPYDMQQARHKLNLPSEKKIVLFIGDPAKPTKRFDLASAACAIASESFDLQLLPLYNQPHEMVPWFMGASDVLILTSTNEGSPNVVKEALACNLPVVSTNVGDVLERIANDENCVVVDNETPISIAAALVRVLSLSRKPNLRYLVDKLDTDVWASKVVQVYKQVLYKSEVGK